MKKFLIALFLLLIMPFPAFAISLTELQSNPDRYIVYAETPLETIYIDINSIKSIRYAPPYYTMQAKIFFVAYDLKFILEEESSYNYNYNRSFETLIKKQSQLNPSGNVNQIIGLAKYEAEKDSGIIISNLTKNIYDFNGTYFNSGNPRYGIKAEFLSNVYRMANFIFKKYYSIQFWPTK